MVDRVAPAIVRISTDVAVGSGVIVEADVENETAYVLTNHHVIDGAARIDVTVDAAATYRAAVVAFDASRDLAVLQICCDPGFTVMPLASPDDVRPGEPVVAIGYPLGASGLTISEGFVLDVSYDEERDRYEIETDTAISPGSSGGPLTTPTGTVAGINTYALRAAPYLASVEGFGFAIGPQTLIDEFAELRSGASTLMPAPTPEPGLSYGTYTSTTYAWQINVPTDWTVDASDPDRVLVWKGTTGAAVSVRTTPVSPYIYPDTGFYRAGNSLTAASEWSSFVILREFPGIFRTLVGGGTTVVGHEFVYTYDWAGRAWRGTTHWFVTPGRLYTISMSLPTDIEGLDEYAGLDLEHLLTLISFHPPG